MMSEEDVDNPKIESARDVLVMTLGSARQRVADAITDVSEAEYHWEPLSEAERTVDFRAPVDQKRVWRVFQQGETWLIDYTPEILDPPPFTTIAWIMNHIAITAQMYLYCIQTGEPEGVSLKWDDLPLTGACKAMRHRIYQVLDETEAYLVATAHLPDRLKRLTPAPWGEMRPVYLNLWGGIIGHTLEHATHISVVKQGIRGGYYRIV